jgi:hypothetical protein
MSFVILLPIFFPKPYLMCGVFVKRDVSEKVANLQKATLIDLRSTQYR